MGRGGRTDQSRGWRDHINHKIIGIDATNEKIHAVKVLNRATKEVSTVTGDYVFSTMPVQELIHGMHHSAPRGH